MRPRLPSCSAMARVSWLSSAARLWACFPRAAACLLAEARERPIFCISAPVMFCAAAVSSPSP
ncbi:MAG: hypothetical protein LUD82_08630 [Clostridiales bacterium]|nr:hypothetical protein [Clostridiales bacterium]